MANLNEILTLDVGGVRFRTSRQTLIQHSDSMLATMFLSDLPPSKMIDGAYFIDRDPER